MRILSFLTSQVLRSVMASYSGNVYMPDAVNDLRERYGFLQFPTTLQEYNASTGITFLHGKFTPRHAVTPTASRPKGIVIDKFQVYNNGILAQSKSYVEDIDLFLNDMIQWAVEHLGLVLREDSPIRNSYLSQLEVLLNVDLNKYAHNISPLSKRISSLLKGYGQKTLEYEVSNLSLHCDTTQLGVLSPSSFIIERKVQTPYNSKIYVTSAPLKTSDHIKMLEFLEKSTKK